MSAPRTPISHAISTLAGDRAPDEPKIPKAVIKRLSLYSRVLQEMEMKGLEKVSSKDLASALGLNSAQVRKDLAYFGQFGVPGLGYFVAELRARVKGILRTDRVIRLALIGVGNLGSALLSYGGFAHQGFRVVAAFDTDKRKVGSTRSQSLILDMAEMQDVLQREKVDIVIMAIPAENAQEACDRVVAAGVKAILNFVPTRLVAPKEVKIHYVDLSLELESLSFYLK